IVQTYVEIAADPERLDQALTRLPRHHARATIAQWRAMAADGEIEALATQLMQDHYDPAYRRSHGDRTVLATLDLAGLAPDDLSDAAARIARVLSPGPTG
ncbi:MAG: tRNA 2-selenouridine(34) synthase MnmH, partial [Brevundimonas sp.]|nr:tRNA 2-selenouridine(34) synthase MnmH [Brevundimonas sp.]